MLIRHAVVPNVMLCHHGSSIGIAVRIPEQQHSASVSTNGAVRDRRIVFGNDRLRSSPEQNGHFHRVAPSPSGPVWRGDPPPAPRLYFAPYPTFSSSSPPPPRTPRLPPSSLPT